MKIRIAKQVVTSLPWWKPFKVPIAGGRKFVLYWLGKVWVIEL